MVFFVLLVCTVVLNIWYSCPQNLSTSTSIKDYEKICPTHNAFVDVRTAKAKPQSKALVTGVAGFIGSHVAMDCVKLGFEVVGVDDMSGGFHRNIPDGIRFVPGDLKDPHFVATLMTKERFDIVYHLAAYAAEGLSHFIRNYNYNNNLIATTNLITQSVRVGSVKKIVFTSSIATYGSGRTPMTEDMEPLPEDPYGIAKLACEYDLRAAQKMFGLSFVIFRPHNVYGPGQNMYDKYRNVVGIFLNQLQANKPLTVFGDGQQTRKFSYISDVSFPIAVSGVLDHVNNEVFNVGGDIATNVNELATVTAELWGNPDADILHLDSRNEVAHAESSHAKLSCFFPGLPAPVGLRAGMQKMVQWAKSTGKYFQPVVFDAVELKTNMPPSWLTADMKEVPAFQHDSRDNILKNVGDSRDQVVAAAPDKTCSQRMIDRIHFEYQSKQRSVGGGCNGDIAEHLPVLKELAMDPKVRHVSEVGVRNGYATFAFLDAALERWQSGGGDDGVAELKIRLYDITQTTPVKQLLNEIHTECNALDVKFTEGDDLKVHIEKTDLMLLDTWHSYRQLAAELKVIPQRVNQRIAFHDTELFGHRDEGESGHGGKPVDESLFTGMHKKTGLRPAIDDFLKLQEQHTATSAFVLEHDKKNCNGLLILKRESVIANRGSSRSQNLTLSTPIASWRAYMDNLPKQDTLLSIHTSMSAWNMTQIMLISLAAVRDEFDVVLVDDHSEFDIESMASKWGVKVLKWGMRSESPRGLTHSWNIAWKYALDNGYDNIIIANNDLLIPDGTINKLTSALRSGEWDAVVPVVSRRGSQNNQHNLNQRYKNVHEWTNQPLNYRLVADVLTRMHTQISEENMLNGYMMALRITSFKNVQYDMGSTLLFDPKNINVGNEDELFRRASNAKLRLGVHGGAFVFHFKGYTLTGSNRNSVQQKLGSGPQSSVFFH